MSFRWQFADCSPAAVSDLASQLGISDLFARCLIHRGCSSAELASRFLQPRLANLSDPFLLPQMDQAVDRLLQAHQNQERFVIFGDYDVDGVTATALLTEFFQALGWHSSHYLPHRMEEGYGLSADGVQNCLKKFPVTLLLAIDCGSKDFDVIQSLRHRGVDVLVLDHHQTSAPLPPALALVNPQLLPEDSPASHLRTLCSAGLAFKLAHALLKRCRSLGWPEAHSHDLKQYLDLVALGTIADIVPLKGENRVFVRFGLERLCNTSRPGLKSLKRLAGAAAGVDCQQVAFQIAPRLNAAGRLETALDSLELLLTRDENRANSLAEALDTQNRERQSIERKIVDEVLTSIRSRFDPSRDFAIVEGDPNWHVGVVGIVASRVLREFHRPVLILGSDGSESWRGSGRSIEGFDLAAHLRQCGDLLLKHGGHAMAAGVTMRPERLPDFRERINQLARSALSPESLQRTLRLDAEISLADLNFNSIKLLEQLQPVGHQNPPVQLAARNLHLSGSPRRLGADQQHLRFNVSDGRVSHQAIWWSCGPAELPPRFDLAFAPEFSEYNGTVAIQLRVLDLKPV
jgi:single-stranded-DNA-specific exonuclease